MHGGQPNTEDGYKLGALAFEVYIGQMEKKKGKKTVRA